MTCLKLYLKPTDTFFFRDGKPFSRGEQSEAAGIFPPFPSTVYGALRTAYISEYSMQAFKQGDLKHVIGTTDPDSVSIATFRVKGIFLANKTDIYFPLPRDLVKEKEGRNIFHLVMSDNKQMHSNAETSCFLVYYEKQKAEYPVNSFFDELELRDYLLDDIIPGNCILEKDFLNKEPKIGIGRNSQTLTSKEGLLYRLDMMRLAEDYQLCVETSGITFPNNQGLIKLGGENKPFAYKIDEIKSFSECEEIKGELTERLENTRQNGKICFKLYFATPTIWKQGWAFQDKFAKGIRCKLITAAVGKYMTVGGWDMAQRKPKTMYRAVPSGSVYYLEAVSGNTTAQEIINAFHYQNISDKRSEEGFGLALVGAISEDIWKN